MNELLREPPFSDEAELAVLTGICWRDDAMDDVADQLDPEHFYRTAHKYIFRAMQEIHAIGAKIDLVTLGEKLKESGQLDAAGGLAFLTNLLNTVTTSANIIHHAKIVLEKAQLRSLIGVCHNALADAYSPEKPASEIIDAAQAAIMDLSSETATDHLVSLDEALRETFTELDKLARGDGVHAGLPTGYCDLDRLTGGFDPGNLIIVGARPSVGKSAFALNIAANLVLGHKKRVLFCSLEMSRQELTTRLIARESRLDSCHMRSSDWLRDNFDTLTNAANRLWNLGLFIDDSAVQSLESLRAKARRLKGEGLDLVIVDYIQLMKPPPGNKGRNREQEISALSRGLKLLAKELGLPVIALAQLHRIDPRRADQLPYMSDLRESGAQEQDADKILMLHRDLSDDAVDPEDTDVFVRKNRNGKIGSEKLRFRLASQGFETPAREPYGAAPPSRFHPDEDNEEGIDDVEFI